MSREETLRALAALRFTGEVRAVPEGRVVFAGEPLLEVTAPIAEAQLAEKVLLNHVTFQFEGLPWGRSEGQLRVRGVEQDRAAARPYNGLPSLGLPGELASDGDRVVDLLGRQRPRRSACP
jgi:nicotinic acid phosphoribosyltransferase